MPRTVPTVGWWQAYRPFNDTRKRAGTRWWTYNLRMPASFLPPPPSWLTQAVGALQPPPWLLHELQQKSVLFINHVLLASPEALTRTRALNGRSVQLRWQAISLHWVFTPAGLLEPSDSNRPADLTLSWGDLSMTDLAEHVLRAQRPPLRIEGDVQMASAIQWLVDHVRWDFREDLARLVGDAPAQALTVMGQRLIDGLRQFAAKVPGAQRA